MSTLYDAVFANDVDKVYECIFDGVDVNVRNEVGNQAIHAASRNGNNRILDILIKAGADINATGVNKNRPIHFACLNGNFEFIKHLVELGADLTVLNAKNMSPRDLVEPSNPHLSEIEEFFDEWIINRCLFLETQAAAPKQKSVGLLFPKREKITTETQASSMSQIETNRPPPLHSSAWADQSEAPLIQSENSVLHKARLGSTERTLQRLSSLGSPTNFAGLNELESPKSPMPELPIHVEPSVLPASPIETTSTEIKEKGYWIEIDGREVYIPDEGWEASESETEEAEELVSQESSENSSQNGKISSLESGDVYEIEFGIAPCEELGFGMLLEESGSFTRVAKLHPDGPSKVAGIQVGDIVVSVNQESTAGMTVHQVKHILKIESSLNHTVDLVMQRSKTSDVQ